MQREKRSIWTTFDRAAPAAAAAATELDRRRVFFPLLSLSLSLSFG